MATYTFAEVPKWVRKKHALLEAVMQQATNDLLNDIEIVPGINRGGSRVRGTIPRDLGALASSLQSKLYGSTMMSADGEAGWIGVVASMSAGDVMVFSWGGPAAPYARHVYYGANGVPGTFWIEEKAGNWQTYVNRAVARARAQGK